MNLHEKMHHSMHIYVLITNFIFSSMSKYTPVFVIGLIPLGLQALYLFFGIVLGWARPNASTSLPVADAPGKLDLAIAGIWGAVLQLLLNLAVCVTALLLPSFLYDHGGLLQVSIGSCLNLSFVICFCVCKFMVFDCFVDGIQFGLVLCLLVALFSPLALTQAFSINWTIAKSWLLIFVCIGSGALFVFNFLLAWVLVTVVAFVLLPVRTNTDFSFSAN
jgi:hypothetical protein